ncbi:MAG: TRAP transporter substrate-binding protein [Firmicutes bacterium]|nr:TRAP transporter substrate-binding protein [Bacillota bacterium]
MDLTMKPVDLKLAHFFPAAHPAEKELAQGWANAVNNATKGQVTITSYPGETLLAAAEIYDGVVTGIADVGLSCFSYTRGRFPLLEAFELPGILYKNSKVASKVANEGIEKLNPEEIQDTKLMMVLATGSGDLFTKIPIRNLKDLEGLEIRATGLSAKTVRALGAIPVAMPQSEAYEALAKGVVKGNLSPIEVLQGWRHAEVTDYLTITPFLYNTLFFVTMNLDVWNSLPIEIQAAIEEVNTTFHEDVAMDLWDKQNESALKYAVEETGIKVIDLSDEETTKWMLMMEPIQDEFIADMEEAGLPGEKALDTVKQLAAQYNEMYR